MSRPKGSKNKRQRQIMAEDTQKSVNVKPENESLKEAKQQSSGVSVAIDEEADIVDSYGGDCQNCLNHGKRTELATNGSCPTCGFDKSKLYGAF